ncbi:MAG TPA: hydrogenase expression/formation protein HypE [Polyangiaceae bacterium]|nr:hydrogenase expression/formation protein HypE [Polyangiaceae bacterium]
MTEDFEVSCPLPLSGYDRVVLGHGSGGRLSHDLLERCLLPALGCDLSRPLEDQALLEGLTGRLAFTTDAFVVKPLFFPGGDIGRLAVFGTVNDLAVGGAIPRHLALSFILEEGLPLETLERVAHSIRTSCDEARVRIVTGDTKVVERGKADGLYITTTGIGTVASGRNLSVAGARPGDSVLVSGTIGDHGIAVMAEREGLELESPLVSDTAPLVGLVQALLEVAPGTRCLRDPTRGGLASTLNEIARASRVGIRLDESSIPLRDAVRAACELLGFDPLYVACEGRLVAIVPREATRAALEALRSHELGSDAALIGEVVAERPGLVTERSLIGGERVVVLLSGEQLPRIC